MFQSLDYITLQVKVAMSQTFPMIIVIQYTFRIQAAVCIQCYIVACVLTLVRKCREETVDRSH
jgi:hypothetical protein